MSPLERAQLEPILGNAIVGAPATVRERLERFARDTGADEIIVATQVYDHAARLRSYELVAACGHEIAERARGLNEG
jgi:alkanesulfonate monooxygenase SsuD/methylene tetrahydromethanopterin reductase-like flavin-dependent oxidoreductase (luciferase family)